MHQKYPNSLLPIHYVFHSCAYQERWQTQSTCGNSQVLYLRSVWLSACKDDIKQHARETKKHSACTHIWIPQYVCLLPFYRSGVLFPHTEDSQHKGIQDLLHSNSVLCQWAQGLRELSNQGWKDSNICLLVMFFYFFHLINRQNHIFSVISTLNRILSLLHSFVCLKRHLRMNTGVLDSFPSTFKGYLSSGYFTELPEACLRKLFSTISACCKSLPLFCQHC